jgi:hypothetical protein
MAHAGGRPRIYDNYDELDEQVSNYFLDPKTVKPTVTGLALYLGFADKTTLYEYRDRPELSYPIKRALTMIEQYHEEGLSDNNVAGRIFALKNMGWKDKTEQDLNLSGGITWNEQKTYVAPGGAPMETKAKVLHTKGGDVPL